MDFINPLLIYLSYRILEKILDFGGKNTVMMKESARLLWASPLKLTKSKATNSSVAVVLYKPLIALQPTQMQLLLLKTRKKPERGDGRPNSKSSE